MGLLGASMAYGLKQAYSTGGNSHLLYKRINERAIALAGRLLKDLIGLKNL
jgi:hypothetical protein